MTGIDEDRIRDGFSGHWKKHRYNIPILSIIILTVFMSCYSSFKSYILLRENDHATAFWYLVLLYIYIMMFLKIFRHYFLVEHIQLKTFLSIRDVVLRLNEELEENRIPSSIQENRNKTQIVIEIMNKLWVTVRNGKEEGLRSLGGTAILINPVTSKTRELVERVKPLVEEVIMEELIRIHNG